MIGSEGGELAPPAEVTVQAIDWTVMSLDGIGGGCLYCFDAKIAEAKRDSLRACMDWAVWERVNAGSNMLVVGPDGERFYLDSGWADIERKVPIGRDSIFRCYSMTKPVAACAAMVLMQDGTMDVDEPVSRYIPSFKRQWVSTPRGDVPAAREATILNLLDMTAGLAYDGVDSVPQRETMALFEEAERRLGTEDAMTTQEFALRVGECRLMFHPGSGWNYGVCADVLGAVIERIADMPFGEFVKRRVLDPLDMADSGFSVPEAKRDRLVTAYEQLADPEGGERLSPYTGNHLAIRNTGEANPFHSGGAGLFATVDDYARFARMLMNGGVGENGRRVLREGAVRFMTGRCQSGRPQRMIERNDDMQGCSYGNLLRVMLRPERSHGPANAGEYGWNGWLGTHFVNDPATGSTLIVMQNQLEGQPKGFIRRLRCALML